MDTLNQNEKAAGSSGQPSCAEPLPGVTAQNETATSGDVFKEWALVELFGHQKIVGMVSETTLFGGALLRVDVPPFDGKPAFTRFYNPKAIYSLNPISEEVARGMMERYRNEPVSRFELPTIEDRHDFDEP